jgi:alpha-tubulin suppressor-like RCC1 family protein
MAHDVFISYSNKDKHVADGICVNLEAAGVRCWIAPRDIGAGEDWPTAITRAITQSRIMVLVFSASSNSSDDVSRELILAANSKLVIIPFKIEDVEPEPGKRYYLARTHWLDAINPPTKEQIRTLLNRVKALLQGWETPPVLEVQPTTPPGSEKNAQGIEKPEPQPIPKKKAAWMRFLWIPGILIILSLASWFIFNFFVHPAATVSEPTPTNTVIPTITASETALAPTLTTEFIVTNVPPQGTLSAPAVSIGRIAAGGWHTCIITDAGGVKCWGANDWHQLGNWTTTFSNTPMDVEGLTGNMVAIVAGASHTCALTAGGGVKCWGSNDYGQLGDGGFVRKYPGNATGLASGMTAITAINNHTCTLTAGGGVKCWGLNDYGQLGDGTLANRSTPVDVIGLTSGVNAISAGGSHTCALTAGGGVKCWGDNEFGQLGDGTNTRSSTPVEVSGLANGVTAIAAGGWHTCALTRSGGAKCWGSNSWGQLGDGKNYDTNTPVNVTGLASGLTFLAATGGHTCALTTAGGVKCWGSNEVGQLGDTTNINRNTPVDVNGLTSGVTAIGVGSQHTCVVTLSGGIKCWGFNDSGQLGDGTNVDSNTPVDVIWPPQGTP